MRSVFFDAAENPSFVVSDCASQLVVGLKLIERVRVEREIQETFRGVTVLDAIVNELVEERRFPDAPPTDESEKRLILELAPGFVRARKVIEIAFLSGGQ